MNPVSTMQVAAPWMKDVTDTNSTSGTSGTSTDSSTDPTSEFAAALAAMLMPFAPPPPPPAAASGGNAATLASSAQTSARMAAVSDAATKNAGIDELGAKNLAESAPSADTPVAAAVGGTASVTSVNNDLSALNPVFRARLQRVIDRMQNEYGQAVSVVEGVRSQARQNFLYEQGRTRPGEVVTWTHNSKHLTGTAVDVKIDGTYDNAQGYQHLAQIASEEGLHTLGARDPGHLEMPTTGKGGISLLNSAFTAAPALSNGSLGNDAQQHSAFGQSMSHEWNSGTSDTKAQRAGAATPAGVASVASTADVARVADVAQVAQVAQVAPVATPVMPTLPNGMATASVQSPRLAGGVGAAESIEKTMALRDAAGTRPLSHVTLAIDNDAGGTDHVRVQLRGTTVDTTIALSDPRAVGSASLRVGELQSALERHGLNADAVRITGTTGHTIDPTTHTFDTGAGSTPRQGQDSAGSFASEREPSTPRDQRRDDAGTSRHRARHAPNDRRQ